MTLTAKAPETDELQEQARGTVQLSQAERMTMEGHIRNKLRLGRIRYSQTLEEAGQIPKGTTAKLAEADDDMQVLARDIDMSNHTHLPPAPVEKPAAVIPAAPPKDPPVATTTPAASKWPLAAALALGLGIPAVAGIFMAPSIISALHPSAATKTNPEYQPILLPGKPQGTAK